MAQAAAVDSSHALGETLYGLVTLAIRGRARDVSLTSASTMSTLDRTGPLRLTELATIEGVAQPSMTALVTGLERSGYVERRPDPNDKRVVLVALTDAGRAHMHARRQAGAQRFAVLVDRLSPEDVEALTAALPALDHLRELDDPPRSTSKEEA
jgi:DNA-binding MarR family transcriptional regulator